MMVKVQEGRWIELLSLFEKLGKYEWVFLLNYDNNVENTKNNRLQYSNMKLRWVQYAKPLKKTW